MKVKYRAQEHNAMPGGRKPGPFDPESSALTIKPRHLPWRNSGIKKIPYEVVDSKIPEQFDVVPNQAPSLSERMETTLWPLSGTNFPDRRQYHED